VLTNRGADDRGKGAARTENDQGTISLGGHFTKSRIAVVTSSPG
jgi:hypothetical protein